MEGVWLLLRGRIYGHRLIVAVDYQRQAVFIRFIGMHAPYDKIDAEVV
jgi:mRNA-degrading endonuclease HigB of HigAB toxin-antitoxin module